MRSRKNKRADFPAWHPDYRITEDLPDIKAVRTDFLINTGSALLAAALLIWMAYREANIASLQKDLATLQIEEERLEDDNRDAVALNTRFMKRKQIYEDLEKFYDAPVDVPLFLADIGRIRPGDISFEEIAYKEIEEARGENLDRTYRIFLRGQTRNLQEIDLLKDSLNNLPYLEGVEAEITEGSNPRNPSTNTFGFSLEVRFKPLEDKGEDT